MDDVGRRAAEPDALDQRTFDRFRSRLAGIEADVPDPPPPAVDRRPGTARFRTPRLDRRERERHVYVLLVVAIAALAVVLLPYVSRPRTGPLDQLAAPLPSASPVAVGEPTPTSADVEPTPTPAGVPEPRPYPIRHTCPLGPILFEGPWFASESWAGADWAVIEGRLKASAEHRLMVWGTRGPFAGPTRSVTWPSGWAEQPSDAGLMLLDRDGRALAREGDLVMIGGTTAGSDGWHACGIRVLRLARTR